MNKEYLGDGVYVEVKNGMVKLTTHSGPTESNTIYMEKAVIDTFLLWLKRLNGVNQL